MGFWRRFKVRAELLAEFYRQPRRQGIERASEGVDRVLLCLALSVLLLPVTTPAVAQTYPTKPIRMIIPYPAGGGIDLVARPLAQKMSESFDQQVVVDNRGGASGSIAMEIAANSPADGYTIILVLNTQLAVNPSLYTKVPYDPIRDFAPIALLGSVPYFLVANPSLPAKTVRELVALAKAMPGKLSYASSGTGSGAHLAMELLKTATRIEIVHVPYKATASGVTDVISGQMPLMFVTFGTVSGQLSAGKLRPIAVTSLKRVAVAPEIPTVAESGFPNYEVVTWYGMLAPAGTPKQIIARLNSEILRAIKSPDYQKRLAADAVEVSGSTPEYFEDYIKTELKKWAKIVKDSGAKLD